MARRLTKKQALRNLNANPGQATLVGEGLLIRRTEVQGTYEYLVDGQVVKTGDFSSCFRFSLTQQYPA